MCGIYSILNNPFSVIQKRSNNDIALYSILEKIKNISFQSGKARGPDDSEFEIVYTTKKHGSTVAIGFHRLAINGLDYMSNQPLRRDNCILICNGEIYNYTELSKKYTITLQTHSDCEIIIPLYKQFGFDTMIHMLDGVFSFVLIDLEKRTIFISRDPFGVRPLYELQCNSTTIAVSSNLKQLTTLVSIIQNYSKEEKYFSEEFNYLFDIQQVKPGTYRQYNASYSTNDLFQVVKSVQWYSVYSLKSYPTLSNSEMVFDMIRNSLYDAVLKRVHTTDREICCLLSGGLDSSLITSIVHSMYQTPERLLKTFSIGLKGSEDLKYAKLVADYLQTDHTEIIVSEKDFLDAIPNVIQNIESYDTTTIRASTGNYLVSKYIREHSDCKVVFNGDGADELMGGYMYMHCSPDANEFDKECRRLLNDIYYFDVLRSDRSISSNGLEARTPFLDKTFVSTYMSIPETMRFHFQNNQCEKWLIRKAFENENVLPKQVLWRTKEAFSDGVSSQKKSWYQIIQEHIETIHMDTHILHYIHNTPRTKEQLWYRTLFEKEFGVKDTNVDTTIPYFWMPKFIENVNDASARTLDIYKKTMNNEANGS